MKNVPPLPLDWKNQFDMLWNINDHKKIIHGSCMEINFDVIKNETLCKWTKKFLQHGFKLFPVNVQKKLTTDILAKRKGFFTQYHKDNSGKHCLSEPMRIVAVCFF